MGAATTARRRRWPRIFALLSGTVLLALIGIGCAITCRPDWYQPAAVDYSRLDQDKLDLMNLADRVSAALNARQTVEIEVREDQLNRWIAARREWPEGERIDLGRLVDPYVDVLDKDRLRLAAIVEESGFRLVAALTLRARIENDRVLVTWETVQAGAAPAPRGLIEDMVREQLADSRLAEYLTPDGAIALPNRFVWPNGKVPCRVESIRTDAVLIRIRLAPLPK